MRASSSMRMRRVAPSKPATSDITGVNHVARESALTAMLSGTRPRRPSRRASVSAWSRRMRRAAWTRISPASVAVAGVERRTSTRPVSLSSALIR